MVDDIEPASNDVGSPIDEGLNSSLEVLTSPEPSIPIVPADDTAILSTSVESVYIPLKFGTYLLEEEDLSEEDKRLLHGRAFIIDNEVITAVDSNSPQVYYIAADQVNGLVIPARSISIDNEGPEDLFYRWTDDGEKWTSWVTLSEGETHDYDTYEKCRFAEVQVYAALTGVRVSIRATR